jgi:hypothetical protein
MKPISVTAVAAVWALTMLPLEAKADAQGLNMQSFRRHHHRPFVQWPWYGYYDWAPYTYDDSIDLLGARDSRGQTRSARGWMSTY